MKRALFVLLVASLAALATPVLAGQPGKDGYTRVSQVQVPPSALAGFGNGTIIDWADAPSQVRFNIQPDIREGTDLTTATTEWTIEAYDTACGDARGPLVYAGTFVNTPSYGPRLHEFPTQSLIPRITSFLLVHDGSTPAGDGGAGHEHAVGNPGRHELACVDIADHVVPAS